jgi:hypothetical protein
MYLSETVDGEVTLAPSQATEFAGASLPAGWTPSVLAAGGTAAVAGGNLGIDGAALIGTPVAGAQTLEFVATFNASNQNIGLGTSGSLVSGRTAFTPRASTGRRRWKRCCPASTGAGSRTASRSRRPPAPPITTSTARW